MSGCNAAGTDCNVCGTGETLCSSGCEKLGSDPNNCGTCGHVCPDPPVVGSASATCSAGACGLACDAGYLACGGTSYCQIAGWGFEGTTTEGFGTMNSGQMALTSISVSGSVFHGGAQALALGIDAQGHGAARRFDVGLSLCGGGGYVLANAQTVSAWFYLRPDSDSAPPPDPASQIGVRLTTSTGVGGNTASLIPVGMWFQVSTPIASVGGQLLELDLQGTFGSASDWTGVIYVDDVVIQ